ncbi:MAG: hypothetical protein WCJ28_04110 [Actinomycetota bacterium]
MSDPTEEVERFFGGGGAVEKAGDYVRVSGPACCHDGSVGDVVRLAQGVHCRGVRVAQESFHYLVTSVLACDVEGGVALPVRGLRVSFGTVFAQTGVYKQGHGGPVIPSGRVVEYV